MSGVVMIRFSSGEVKTLSSTGEQTLSGLRAQLGDLISPNEGISFRGKEHPVETTLAALGLPAEAEDAYKLPLNVGVK
jgi:hypothetical protein